MRVLFIMALLISGVVTAQTKVEKELVAFNDRFNEVVANKDMKGFLDLYSKKVWWIAPATPPVVGHGEPTQTFQFIIANQGELTHTIDKLSISQDGTQAVMIGTAIVKVDKVGLDTDGTYLFVLEKENGAWKIQTDMWHQHTKK
ncbi:DUF4440 domain-containing protein [Marinomonas agarivorans]|nr:DUF4440 domain-containing protein [Marinomonas agarivorans]